MYRAPLAILSRFARDESGVVMAETVIVLPILLWTYMAMFVYWDSFRTINSLQKAAYTVSDLISRETEVVPEAYVDGMGSLMQYLIDDPHPMRMRLTSVTYNGIAGEFQVHWSRSPGSTMALLTTATLQAISDCASVERCHIPDMADGDYVILLETELDTEPMFNVGLDDRTIRQLIVTRPRFVPKICLVGTC